MHPFLSSMDQADTALFSSGRDRTVTWIFSFFWECAMLCPLDVSCLSSESLPSWGILGKETLLSRVSDNPLSPSSPERCSVSRERSWEVSLAPAAASSAALAENLAELPLETSPCFMLRLLLK